MQELIKKAQSVRERAYAPYSKYFVGAALIDDKGKTWVGCNFENISFGATICAERGAIGSMVAGGGKKWTTLVVCSEDGVAPCGMCLQVLSEFAMNPDTCKVLMVDKSGTVCEKTFSEFLPHSFKSSHVKRS